MNFHRRDLLRAIEQQIRGLWADGEPRTGVRGCRALLGAGGNCRLRDSREAAKPRSKEQEHEQEARGRAGARSTKHEDEHEARSTSTSTRTSTRTSTEHGARSTQHGGGRGDGYCAAGGEGVICSFNGRSKVND